MSRHLDHLRLRGLRDTTITQRRYALRRLSRWLEPTSLICATREDLDRWQTTLTRLTPVARCCEISHVSGFYGWAAEQGLRADDPTRILVRPKRPRRLPRPIGEADLRIAIACATQPVRCWLVLAAYCGLRAGEISRLQRHDVLDTADPPILIVDGKGGRQRVVPLPLAVIDEIRLAGLPPRGYLFQRPSGGPYPPPRVSQVANRYLHDLGISDTLHQLRHRYGTGMYRVSTDFRMVQEVMGHEDPSSTAGYVAFTPSRAVSAAEQLALTLHSRQEVVA